MITASYVVFTLHLFLCTLRKSGFEAILMATCGFKRSAIHRSNRTEDVRVKFYDYRQFMFDHLEQLDRCLYEEQLPRAVDTITSIVEASHEMSLDLARHHGRWMNSK